MNVKKKSKLTPGHELPAGEFSLWLDRTRNSQKTGEDIAVPCGDCTACCRSSYFIHIKPDETKTIAKIPEELMFPAPGLPEGNVLLGFNKKGLCPMFADNKCSIYDYRPLTCRTYDCRIFKATGLDVEDDRVLIYQQSNRWKFNFSDKRDLKNHRSLRAAAKFINDHAGAFPEGFIPGNIPQKAMIAVKIYEVFIKLVDETEQDIDINPDDRIIKEIIKVYENSVTDNRRTE